METQTSEETQEETKTEPVEETTETQEKTSEETSEETVKKETSKTQTVDYEAKFKASQAEAIRLKKENEGLRKDSPKGVNVDEIVEIQAATKDLSPEEISELKVRATSTGKSLTEARKDENFILWQKAYQEKVERENAPEPSTKQGASGNKSIKDMTQSEKEEYYVKQGFIKASPKPKPIV